MSTDFKGQSSILLLDVPINFILKLYGLGQVGETAHVAASVLGASQYYLFGSIVRSSGALILNSNTWDALSALATTAMGALYFGETLDTTEWIATFFMLTGLVILGIHEYK